MQRKNFFVFVLILVFCFSFLQMKSEAAFLNDYRKKRFEKKLEKEKREKMIRNTPITVEEYENLTKDIKTSDVEIPMPSAVKDAKLINEPKQKFELGKYNFPAGFYFSDFSDVQKNGQQFGNGVATPQGDKLAYSAVYFNKLKCACGSEIFLILNSENKSTSEFLKIANVANKINVPILSSGIGKNSLNQQNILIIVDWSRDGQKLAIKETIGVKNQGVWKTNLWVYDVETREARELFELRNAISSWFRENKKIKLENYMWDIHPVGWAKNDSDKIVVHAVGYTGKVPLFLGEWVVNYDGSFPELVSEKEQVTQIESNGLMLRFDNKY